MAGKGLSLAVASKAHVHAAAFSMREDSYFYCVEVRKMGNYPVIDPVATGINIYKWIHGTSMPTLDNVMALSMLFGVSVNDIVVMKKG